MRRRIADYDPALGVETGQILVTLAALIIGWSVLIAVYNFVSSTRTQPVASPNPWRSRSPEWQTSSPPPEFNFDRPIVVVGEPYDYGLPDSTYVRTVPVPAGD